MGADDAASDVNLSQQFSFSNVWSKDNDERGKLEVNRNEEVINNMCSFKPLMMSKCTQTTSPLPICQSRSVQTSSDSFSTNLTNNCDSDGNEQDNIRIHAAFMNNSQLPIIFGNFSKVYIPILLDSGSSINLMDSTTFNRIKHAVHYKHISRKVSISTINSNVEFSACIIISFKIQNKFFKSPFYITNLKGQPFDALLGFEFMSKYRLTFNFEDNSVIIENEKIPLNSFHTSDSNCNIITDSTLMESNDNFSHEKYNVMLVNKLILSPKEKVFCDVKCPFIPETNLLFTQNSKHKNSISFHDAIIPKPNVDEDLKGKNFFSFQLLCTNNTNHKIHVNKSSTIGTLVPIQDKDIQPYPNEEFNLSPNILCSSEKEHVNLIKASKEVLEQRIADLSPDDFDLKHLNTCQKEKLLSLLMKYAVVFSKSLKTLGHTDLVVPDIQLIHNIPLKTLPLPIPHHLKKEAIDQLNLMQEAGVIERSVSNWACPMLLVKKKQGPNDIKPSYRLALDLRLVNSIIKFSSYPLPKINTIIENLANFKFFSTLDLPSAYWQIDLPEHLQEIVSFTTPFGGFRFKRMCFGLKTASSLFQYLMDRIIDIADTQNVQAFQDDMAVPVISFEETLVELEKLLRTFQDNNITLNPAKCSFHKPYINFLGFHVEDNQVTPLSSNIVKITSFPKPKNQRQVKQFLGVCGFYRHLIPSFASLTKPLIQISKPKSTFSWSNEQDKAFHMLQKVFFSVPFLKLPNWSEPFYVNTDASHIAISAVLLQKQGENLLPISYYSKMLSKSESNYPAIKQELMALHHGILAFKNFLFNTNFFVLSDAKSIEKYKKNSNPADLVTRWLMELSEFSFTFQHIPGKSNLLADYMSRLTDAPHSIDLNSNPELLKSKHVLPIIDEDKELVSHLRHEESSPDRGLNHQNKNSNSNITDLDNQKSPLCKLLHTHTINTSNNPVHTQTSNNVDKSNMMRTTSDTDTVGKQDKNCNSKSNNITRDPLLEVSLKTIQVEQENDPFIKEIQAKIQSNRFNNLPYFKHKYLNVICRKINGYKIFQILIPKSLVAKIITIFHVNHLGICKTHQHIAQKYWWPGMHNDIKNFINSCTLCINFKPMNIIKAPLQKYRMPKYPGTHLAMDILGPFSNNKCILTITDIFSRFIQLYPLNNLSAQCVAEKLLIYCSTFGRPQDIITDLGVQFTAEVFEILNRSLGIKLHHSSSGHPSSNTYSERINKSIKVAVKALVSEGLDFDTAILIHQSVYNASIHSTTKFSPNAIFFGRDLAHLYDTFFPNLYPKQLNKSFDFHKKLATLNQVYDQVYQATHQFQVRQNSKHAENPRHKIREFKPGTRVYVKSRNQFKPSFDGPFVILKKISKVTYVIKRENHPQARTFIIHADRMLIAPERKHYLNYDHTFQSLSKAANFTNHKARYFYNNAYYKNTSNHEDQIFSNNVSQDSNQISDPQLFNNQVNSPNMSTASDLNQQNSSDVQGSCVADSANSNQKISSNSVHQTVPVRRSPYNLRTRSSKSNYKN